MQMRRLVRIYQPVKHCNQCCACSNPKLHVRMAKTVHMLKYIPHGDCSEFRITMALSVPMAGVGEHACLFCVSVFSWVAHSVPR